MAINDEKLDKIVHHVKKVAEEMYAVKKAVIKEQEEKKRIAKKEQRRRESLKRAQKKFKNISTNFKIDDYNDILKRVEELNISKSNYIHKLVLLDLKQKLLKKEEDL